MKFKTTIILFSILIILLIFVFFFEVKEKKGEKEEKLVELSSNDVQKIIFKREDGTISFQKDEKGEWLISEPLEAAADKYEVDQLAGDFSDLRVERVVEEAPEDLSQYEIPKKEITLWYKEREKPVKILVGMENPLDRTFFAKREDEKRVVLIPSLLKSLLEKKILDFRKKDIFSFETDKVKNIKLRAKDSRWEAAKKEEEWWLSHPVKAIAQKSRVESITGSLSRLKAKEFVSEEKNAEELKKYGLDRPEYEITLGMPLENKEIIFSLHKQEEKVYATSFLSTKIIEVDGSIIDDLGKKVEELREKEVVQFNSWEASKVFLKKGELEIKVSKDKEDRWHFETTGKEEADESKVKTFIQKIESLSAEEFIDPPLDFKKYGLDRPQAEVTIWTKGDDEPEEKAKEFKVLIGSEDKEAKKVVVKNARLDYLFKVDSAFLGDIPREAKDWMKEKEKEKK